MVELVVLSLVYEVLRAVIVAASQAQAWYR